ncbi:MAG: 4Fe-4S binding protein [Acidimicrobiales bacterium]
MTTSTIKPPDQATAGDRDRPGTASDTSTSAPVEGSPPDPIAVAVHLRPQVRSGMQDRFAPSDPARGLDVTRNSLVARLVRNRHFQFFLILPNQIVFWAVIFIGILGTTVPGLNFGAAITWYIWFCLVFVMMVVVGRAWCSMCPFGGFGEWVQRHTFWNRSERSIGLGLKFPEPLARIGFLIPVVSFLLLTWLGEFFNNAGPGNPAATSFMVLGIVGSALAFFLVFERRTFCRYICPLTTLIGTVGSMGTVAGFRTRDRDICLKCETKDCMRGGEHGYGCPWYTWPGSADSNLYCGLCSECYKACPHDNVGLYLQKPLTSVVAPNRRRIDVAWGIALLWGLVLYQQVNALSIFGSLDTRLNNAIAFPHYPDPVGYLGIIALLALATAGAVWIIAKLLARRDLDLTTPGTFLERGSRFRTFFAPIAYGLIPVIGADYFARQLPKFFKHSTRLVPSVQHVFGASGTQSKLYTLRLLTNPRIVVVQVSVIALGTLAALWTTWRITNRELVPVSRNGVAIRVVTLGLVLVCGLAAGVLYVLMHAAS